MGIDSISSAEQDEVELQSDDGDVFVIYDRLADIMGVASQKRRKKIIASSCMTLVSLSLLAFIFWSLSDFAYSSIHEYLNHEQGLQIRIALMLFVVTIQAMGVLGFFMLLHCFTSPLVSFMTKEQKEETLELFLKLSDK